MTDNAVEQELLRLDVLLRRKQVFWETPRAVLLIVATTAAIAGVIGFRIGQDLSAPPAPIVIQIKK